MTGSRDEQISDEMGYLQKVGGVLGEQGIWERWRGGLGVEHLGEVRRKSGRLGV